MGDHSPPRPPVSCRTAAPGQLVASLQMESPGSVGDMSGTDQWRPWSPFGKYMCTRSLAEYLDIPPHLIIAKGMHTEAGT